MIYMKRIFPLSILVLLLSFSLSSAQFGQQDDNSNESTAINGVVGEDGGIFIPNAFTPNDDGVNDVFYIPNIDFARFEFSVFDRWGNRVYNTNQCTFRWDGKTSGKSVPSGIYVFVLNASNGKDAVIKRSGTISIVR